jgi:hypothetical protein
MVIAVDGDDSRPRLPGMKRRQDQRYGVRRHVLERKTQKRHVEVARKQQFSVSRERSPGRNSAVSAKPFRSVPFRHFPG